MTTGNRPRPATAPQTARGRGLLAASLAAAQLSLVGPLAVWVDNRASFAGFALPAALTLGLGFVMLAALVALPARLVPRLQPRWNALLYTLTVLMWGQSFVSGRLLTGTDPAGSASATQQVAELAVWAAAAAAAILLGARRIRLLRQLAIAALAVQILALGWTAWGLDSARLGLGADGREELSQFAALSGDRNILVLVLDGMHRDYVTRALESNPELADRFAGFRVFTDHLASFPTTRFSIPSMLSGVAYDNTVPAEAFIERTLTEGDSAPKRLRDAGWNVGLATTIRAALVAPADHRLAVEAYVRRQRTARALGLELLDLALLRHLPTRIGLWVYDDDRWRLRRLDPAADRNYHAVRSRQFMTDFVAGLRAATDQPVFRFVHVGGAHPPVVVDADCDFVGVQTLSPESYGAQVECALSQAADLLQRLRELDLLDRTAVVITSDHGVDVKEESSDGAADFAWVLDHAAASLMIKPFSGVGEPVFDPAPTSNLDLPAIVRRLADRESDADYLPPTVTPDRVRTFNFHSWQNNDWRKSYLTALHHFRVQPQANRTQSWSYIGTTASPDLPERERARLAEDAATYFPGVSDASTDAD